MSNEQPEKWDRFNRLVHNLADEIDSLSDDELREEESQEYGDVQTRIESLRNLVDSGLSEGGKRRLAAARRGYELGNAVHAPAVQQLSTKQKQSLIERISANDTQLHEKITLAARNEENFEADLDSFLEDLIEIGVIDENGNIL